MTNLDSILKSRDITLPTKFCLVKAMVFTVVIYGCESWTIKKAECRSLMLLNCGAGEDSWESLVNIHWKDWCWSWNSNTLATWWEELTHWKRPWCWERLRAGGEGDDRGWDGWIASLTEWIWVWASSRSWWWTRKPSVLQSVGSQRVGHDWVTELNRRFLMIKWEVSGILLYSTGNSTWYSVMTKKGGMAEVVGGKLKSVGTHEYLQLIHVVCMVETNTTL